MEPAFAFRPLTLADLPMLYEWMRRPHWARWWGEPDPFETMQAEYAAWIADPSKVQPYIVWMEGRAIAYAQSYIAMGSGGGWWEDVTDPGVRGIDQSIADPADLDRGVGTAMVKAFTAKIFADLHVTRIQTDPHPQNARAIRCYEKAGFQPVREVQTPDGPALLMVCERPVDLHEIAVQAMRSRGLLPAFSLPALREAEAAREAGPERGDSIRDLRHLTWFSIDNDDTSDLDQLSVAQPQSAGAARLLVAVADVDCMVRRGGPIDSQAAANTTSVYTAAGVFPMLPELLSTDLTSLHEGQERLAVVVDMLVQSDGTISESDLYRAVVLNRAKLTYNGVSSWLDGGAAPSQLALIPGLEEQLRLHDKLAAQLRQWRQSHGALDMKTVSARPVFRDGRLVDLRPDEKNRAKDLIADLMIATNGATARFLARKGFPSLRRSLQAPRRWDRIVALAATHGTALPAVADAVALDRFLTERREAEPDAFADLSLAVVKLLGSGEYAAASADRTALPHFGLAVKDYAHTTAPNRRYPDLVTQRLVKAALAGDAAPYSVEVLAEIARHCTIQEANANKVERQVLKAAAAYLLDGRIGETFHAVVTGATSKGTFVRISSPLLEGRLVRGNEGLDVGDALRVKLVGVDAAKSFIDFERA